MSSIPDPFANIPPRPQAPRRTRRWPWITAGVIFLAVAAAVGWGGVEMYWPPSRTASLVDIVIAPGDRSTAIGKKLKSAGVIRSPRFFAYYAYVTGHGSRLQVGTFQLPRNLSLPQVLARLTEPKKKSEVKVTVIEGLNNREISAQLSEQGIAPVDAFNQVVQHKAAWWDEYAFLDSRPADRDLEGYLFPDTYQIFTGSSVETLVRKMLDNFDKKLTPELRQEITRQGKTVHAVVTLASIVEREVPDSPDRPKVAGIFLQRLNIGMPLQSDATVNYVTGKKLARPTADDVRRESLYNTYIHRGLPPGPINNPGISAIRAVLYPESSPYLFYLTTPDGTVIYSKTFDEHVRAKARYYP